MNTKYLSIPSLDRYKFLVDREQQKGLEGESWLITTRDKILVHVDLISGIKVSILLFLVVALIENYHSISSGFSGSSKR